MHLILNGEPLDAHVTTLYDLLGPLPEGQAVAVNHVVVPRSQHTGRVLQDDDVIDVVRAVAGG